MDLAVLRKAVTALANRSDDVGEESTARRVALQGDNLVKTVIHRRTNQIVHRRIDDQKILAGTPLEMFDARKEHAGIADHKTPVFEENLEAQRLQQRHERRAIALGSERALLGGLSIPPRFLTARERVLVNDTHPATDREVGDAILHLQFGHKGRNFFYGFDKRTHRSELRANVHLHALDRDVRILRSRLIRRRRVLQRNTKLVTALTRRDFRMRVGVNVGIDADRNRGLHAERAGDVINAGQLGLALDMEGENAVFQRQPDLPFRLADARKDTRVHIRPSCEHPADFATAHQVEARAEIRKVAQHGDV